MSASSTDKCPWSLVKIRWDDAFDSENGWIDLHSYKPEAARFVTVGYLIPDLLDGYLSVTATYDPDEAIEGECVTVGMVTHILARMVTSVQVIE
jgi:hypothetical protein